MFVFLFLSTTAGSGGSSGSSRVPLSPAAAVSPLSAVDSDRSKRLQREHRAARKQQEEADWASEERRHRQVAQLVLHNVFGLSLGPSLGPGQQQSMLGMGRRAPVASSAAWGDDGAYGFGFQRVVNKSDEFYPLGGYQLSRESLENDGFSAGSGSSGTGSGLSAAAPAGAKLGSRGESAEKAKAAPSATLRSTQASLTRNVDVLDGLHCLTTHKVALLYKPSSLSSEDDVLGCEVGATFFTTFMEVSEAH